MSVTLCIRMAHLLGGHVHSALTIIAPSPDVKYTNRSIYLSRRELSYYTANFVFHSELFYFPYMREL
jgi:hypothetical protein